MAKGDFITTVDLDRHGRPVVHVLLEAGEGEHDLKVTVGPTSARLMALALMAAADEAEKAQPAKPLGPAH